MERVGVWRPRGGRRAAACLAAATALATASLTAPAGAQPASGIQAAQLAGEPAANRIRFEITAQLLAGAINTFGRQAGVQVTVDAATVAGVQAGAVSGELTPGEALTRLLAGTGIGWSFSDPRTVVLTRPSTTTGGVELPQLEVEAGRGIPATGMIGQLMPAYTGGQVATGGQVGILGNRGVMDTPFNQTSYTAQTIRDQQARTLADVLDNDPSIRPVSQTSAGYSDLMIRGFPVSGTDIGFNGLYGLVIAAPVSTDSLERVEVLKGPSALLSGMPPSGSVGGTINLVPRRAGEEPVTQLTARYSSRGQVGGHIDVGRRFGPANTCGVRFNGTYTDGETALKENSTRLGAAALALDCRTDRLRVAADFNYEDTRTDGAMPLTRINAGLAIPRAPDNSRPYWPRWWFTQDRSLMGMFSGEYDITSNVTAYAAVGVFDQTTHGVWGFPTVSNAAGDFTASTRNTAGYQRNVSAQMGVRGSFETGPVHHAVNVNLSALNAITGSGLVTAAAFSSNLYAPRTIPNLNIPYPTVAKTSESTLSSLGIADTLSILDNRIQLTLGVRRQQIDARGFDTGGATVSRYDTGVWSPAYALVVKPWSNVSLYANYIEGLQQGTVVGPDFSNAGALLPPFQSKQVEVGVKIDWGRLTTTLSAFQITQPSAIAVPGTPLPSLRIDGEQRNRGIEVNTFGELAPGLRVLGGVMFIEGRQTRTANGLNDGKRAIGVPDVQLNLGAEWDAPFARGLTVSGRLIHTGPQYASADNRQSLPAWTRLDLGARYTFSLPRSRPVTVRFDVQNVTAENYWSAVYSGSRISLGTPRTFLLSTTLSF